MTDALRQTRVRCDTCLLPKRTQAVVSGDSLLITFELPNRHMALDGTCWLDAPGVSVCDTEEDGDSTIYSFPEFKDYEVFCASITKATLRVALTKRKD